MYDSESIVLGSVFEIKILMDSHFLRSPESGNHTFSGLFVCVYVTVTNITAKQIIARNFKIDILHLYHI